MQGQRWVVPGERETRLESFPVPAPGPRQVLLRTEASLVSAGTELAIYTGIHQGLTNPKTTWPKYPQAMGYMAAALRGGAAGAIDPGAGDPAEQLRQLLPEGADIVVDATGWASALPGAMTMAREGGTVLVLGSPRGKADGVDFYSDLHRRSLRIL